MRISILSKLIITMLSLLILTISTSSFFLNDIIMPNCKNNPKKYYKGSEISPKGLGWCPDSEELYKIRIGKDGNKWIIKKTNSGNKKWEKYNDFLKNHYKSIFKKKSLTENEYNKLLDKTKNFDSIHHFNQMIFNFILNSTKKFNKGNFKIKSNKIIISDPAYKYSIHKKNIRGYTLAKSHTVEPGNWIGYQHYWKGKHQFGQPNVVVFTNEKYYNKKDKSIKYKYGGPISVDSGQIIFIDSNYFPKNDKKHSIWHDSLDDSINRSIFGYGYITNTAIGDGMFDYIIGIKNKKVVQLIINFFDN